MEAEDLFGKIFMGGLLAAALSNKWEKAEA
jgi:hypothetical protein